MNFQNFGWAKIAIASLLILACAGAAQGQFKKKKGPQPTGLTLARRAADPFGCPRPAPGAGGVPVRTSLYFEVGMTNPAPGDRVSTPTLAATLTAAGGKPAAMLEPGGRFAPGFSGHMRGVAGFTGALTTGIYIESAKPLDPRTTYTVRVQGRSVNGAGFPPARVPPDRWSFSTDAPARTETIDFELDLAAAPVRWQGIFFSGFMKCGVCISPFGLEPSHEMMARDREKYPNAWLLQRDIWLTGMDHTPRWARGLWVFQMPNLVRELETRRVASITTVSQGCYRLAVEDFFGHEQYGIADGRPLSGDYQKGYEVLIADGAQYARARVIEVDDRAGTVLVGELKMPAEGFTIDDPAKYSTKSDPRAPGLFPLGGCYLRRFAPAGTPRYYWERLDREWDMAKKYGHRLVVNFCEAPGDISDRGQNLCPPKDWVEMHEAVRTIAAHVIERHGAEACYSYTWTMFNEADIGGPDFWQGTQAEILKYYDYATDAVLRAFEDAGLDSDKVFIGGPEFGAIFPNLPRVDEFLRHGSPHGTTTASLNAAFADARLEGKRSRRVETLCGAHGGKGAPCDFISIHCYNASKVLAAKLKLAKDKALAVDADYYQKLSICAHEASPGWCPAGADPSYTDVYLGDGYYPAWCADAVWRLLGQGARDPRYAMGNSLLTAWPWPNGGWGLEAANGPTVMVKVDNKNIIPAKAGTPELTEATLPMPIYPFLNMLGSMGNQYWVLPEREAAGHTVAGFAGRGRDGEVRVMLYAHDPADLQARAGREFEVTLKVRGLRNEKGNGDSPRAALGTVPIKVTRYRFDREHHSFWETMKKILGRAKDPAFSAEEVKRMEEQVALKAEKTERIEPGKDGELEIKATVAGNGAAFLVLEQ